MINRRRWYVKTKSKQKISVFPFFVFERTYFCLAERGQWIFVWDEKSDEALWDERVLAQTKSKSNINRAIFALIPPCPPYPIGSSLQSLMAGPVSAAASAWHLARRHAGVKSKRITDDYCFLNEFEFQRSSRRKPNCNYIFTWSILIQFYSSCSHSRSMGG